MQVAHRSDSSEVRANPPQSGTVHLFCFFPVSSPVIRQLTILLSTLTLLGCTDIGGETPPLIYPTLIIAKVHWGDQGVPDIPVVLVGTGDTLRTDSTGLAVFSVSPGKYVLRAFGINRGGPVFQHIDFDVEAKKGETSFVDIVDCLPCV